jgi:hypothetical protein
MLYYIKIVAGCLESHHFTLSVVRLAEPPKLSTFLVRKYLHADNFVLNVHIRVKKN